MDRRPSYSYTAPCVNPLMNSRGLRLPPRLAIGDGALGFWAGLEEVFPGVNRQRCWDHKTANILDKMPKRIQPHAKKLIHEMYTAPTKTDVLRPYNAFLGLYRGKYPKACECLEIDREVLFTFYDFSSEHWAHIRTTNPIESTFATVRRRTRQTKGCGSRQATLMMVFKLAELRRNTGEKSTAPMDSKSHRRGAIRQ